MEKSYRLMFVILCILVLLGLTWIRQTRHSKRAISTGQKTALSPKVSYRVPHRRTARCTRKRATQEKSKTNGRAATHAHTRKEQSNLRYGIDFVRAGWLQHFTARPDIWNQIGQPHAVRSEWKAAWQCHSPHTLLLCICGPQRPSFENDTITH